MSDNGKDTEYEEFLKLFEERYPSGNTSAGNTPNAGTQQRQPQRNASLQGSTRPRPVSKQNTARSSDRPVRRTQPSKKPGKFLTPKRIAAKKRRQRRTIAFGAITLAVLVLVILLIVKSCSGGGVGGDKLKGTWDLDGVTVYRFDGNGSGSLVLPSNSYPFTYEIKENEVVIDFESDAARDSTYSFTVEKGKLTLVGTEGDETKTFELTKRED